MDWLNSSAAVPSWRAKLRHTPCEHALPAGPTGRGFCLNFTRAYCGHRTGTNCRFSTCIRSDDYFIQRVGQCRRCNSWSRLGHSEFRRRKCRELQPGGRDSTQNVLILTCNIPLQNNCISASSIKYNTRLKQSQCPYIPEGIHGRTTCGRRSYRRGEPNDEDRRSKRA